MHFWEPMSDKLAWLRLRELTDVPSRGLQLFTGSRPTRNSLYNEFRNYIRQAQSYWNAGQKTSGSASTLLYYYGLLNLAKAELLQTNPESVLGKSIHHGLSAKMTTSASIRSDALGVVAGGVFPLLYRKRTGQDLAAGSKLPVLNLMSLVPEVSHEMSHFGAKRPPSQNGYHSFALDSTHAWSMVGLVGYTDSFKAEPAYKNLLRGYDQVTLAGMNWRDLFALSSRITGRGIAVFQSKQKFSTVSGGEVVPDMAASFKVLGSLMGQHLSPPLGAAAEFVLTHSLRKSSPLVLPLSLARYACTFYASSLVRYRPSSLDPVRQGEQAWLMDSFATEVPSNLLADAVAGITGIPSYFESTQFRT